MDFPVIRLKPKEERRLKRGHLWIFSNEIKQIGGAPSAGDLVRVEDAKGAHLCFGYYNGASLIAVRILSFGAEFDLPRLLRDRISAADARRNVFSYGSAYRLAHGEADFMPGLVIDRYDSVFVLESFAAGADRLIPSVKTILVEDFAPSAIVEKSNSLWRTYEGLQAQERLLYGECAENAVTIEGMSYKISILEAQKTGLYLDQRETRLEVERLAAGRRVLDLFCSDGGFALHAHRGGASEVLGVDISEPAIRRASANARLNGMAGGIGFLQRDVFNGLDEFSQSDWDMIILDPPALAKGRKNIVPALKGYRKLNQAALRRLRSGGILVSCSCSQHISEEMFVEMLGDAAAGCGRQLNIFRISGAAKDHPVLPSMPETRYLKCVFAFAERL